MHIKALTVMSILLSGIAACDNTKPADPIVTPPSTQATSVPEATMPTNDVTAQSETTNRVAEPTTATNSVAPPTDEPRGNPDRR